MNPDLKTRLKRAVKALHERSLELSHRSENDDVANILQTLALLAEAQIALGDEVAQISAKQCRPQ